MGKITSMIDNITQEFAEDAPTLMIQKLGELRAELDMKYEGKPAELLEEVSSAIGKIAEKNNATVIGILFTPSKLGVSISNSVHIQGTERNKVVDIITSIPRAMQSIVDSLDKEIPGFKEQVMFKLMLENEDSDPLQKLQQMMSMGKFESDGSGITGG